MIKLANHSRRSRGVPVSHGRCAIVPAGASVDISAEDAKAIEKNTTASRWIVAGVIEIVREGESKEPEQNEDEAKELLIAELAEYGINKNKRSSVESLQAALDEAKAATEPDTGADVEGASGEDETEEGEGE